MGGTRSSWLVRLLIVVLAVALADCAPRKRTRRRSVSRPTPTATPRPAKKPAPSPTRAPARDITREPLTRLIGERTPPRDAAALKLAERAREELDEGTTENAFELLDTAIKNAPNVQPPYVLRARAYLAEGATPQARVDLDKAAALPAPSPWVAEAAAVRGMMFELQGNRGEALAAYRRALRIFPGNLRARDALERLTSTSTETAPEKAGAPQ